jgi:PAS domain S-box-containing protein
MAVTEETEAGRSGLSALQIYVALLGLALVAILIATWAQGPGTGTSVIEWVTFTALFAVCEFIDIFFHHERGRLSQTPNVSVLIPMLVSLSLAEVVWAVTVAVAVVSAIHWREGVLKFVFNVAQYACAAAVAAVISGVIGTGGSFDIRDAVAAAVAVTVFEALTHSFVAGAISLAEGRSFVGLLQTVIPMALPYLAGNTLVGLVLAAAYDGAAWTLALFPLMLLVVSMTSRAVLRQSTERERLEHLHSATRTLAAGWNLDTALAGFLRGVIEITSAAEAHVLVKTNKGLMWSGVRGDRDIARMESLHQGGLCDVLNVVAKARSSIVIDEDDTGKNKSLPAKVGVRSLVAAPLLEDENVVGCLIVCDRIGADEFGAPDAQFLEALADELVITLDSYRLFAEVAEERERFRRIFDGSKEGICLVGTDGVVRAWNPALSRISGYNERETVGRVFWDVVALRNEDQATLKGVESIRGLANREVELVRRDGTSRWIALSPGPLQSGEEAGWVVIVRDITAEHEVEMAKSDFLSTVSHEFRTPLTGIKGALDVLHSQAALPQGTDRIIGVARWGTQRLERLIMSLLAVSEMETEKIPVKTEEFELEDLVHERIESVLGDHSDVEVEVHDDEVIVRGDRQRLTQAIDHLFDNAKKFGGATGRISIELAKADGHAQVSISDDGPGIPKEDQERIFDRFVRLGDLMTRTSEGAGVGLFIAKRSIEAMGGSIWVESEPGQGATFRATLPLAAIDLTEDSEDTRLGRASSR